MKPLLLLLATTVAVIAAPPEPKFKAQDLDKTVQIGYGVAIADVDGDKLPDILLADKKQYRWYKNPGKRDVEWPKYVLAENLTKQDNVCIAAQDIDGDGKCEVAVGAEWNPGDTVNSGAVFYLIAPEDRTKPWEAVKFPSVEPTTHRMRWMQVGENDWGLVVAPLHGRGNKNGEGAGVKVLLYRKPADPKAEWKSQVIDDSMHATHNFAIFNEDGQDRGILLGGKEGLVGLQLNEGKFKRHMATGPKGVPLETKGVGEIRYGAVNKNFQFVAAVEPMHGNTLVAFLHDENSNDDDTLVRHVLTDKLIQGHALACGDVLGVKSDQIVVGWRGDKPGDKVGIAVWTPLDDKGEQWRETLVDNNETACEDLALADLDGDGKLDIIAAGRASHNLRILWNER
jgi:hypothetical protein